MRIVDGGPAFLHHETGDCGTRPGMTLRDYFAESALKEHMRALSTADLGSPERWNAKISEMAYATADAMLKARESTP